MDAAGSGSQKKSTTAKPAPTADKKGGSNKVSDSSKPPKTGQSSTQVRESDSTLPKPSPKKVPTSSPTLPFISSSAKPATPEGSVITIIKKKIGSCEGSSNVTPDQSLPHSQASIIIPSEEVRSPSRAAKIWVSSRDSENQLSDYTSRSSEGTSDFQHYPEFDNQWPFNKLPSFTNEDKNFHIPQTMSAAKKTLSNLWGSELENSISRFSPELGVFSDPTGFFTNPFVDITSPDEFFGRLQMMQESFPSLPILEKLFANSSRIFQGSLLVKLKTIRNHAEVLRFFLGLDAWGSELLEERAAATQNERQRYHERQESALSTLHTMLLTLTETVSSMNNTFIESRTEMAEITKTQKYLLASMKPSSHKPPVYQAPPKCKDKFIIPFNPSPIQVEINPEKKDGIGISIPSSKSEYYVDYKRLGEAFRESAQVYLTELMAGNSQEVRAALFEHSLHCLSKGFVELNTIHAGN